jgi:hypothetical protein
MQSAAILVALMMVAGLPGLRRRRRWYGFWTRKSK